MSRHFRFLECPKLIRRDFLAVNFEIQSFITKGNFAAQQNCTYQKVPKTKSYKIRRKRKATENILKEESSLKPTESLDKADEGLSR